ncbi:MAG: flagellar motor protein MotD [Proteobacteria bacterium]|nr:flagellar motor protein MotD [Pseudomonadota bacterium]
MARKKKHEEHVNAEAWAIPYGDLVTLLLALFVVMYAMSSVNEGKYRILSDSLVAAFRGTPKTVTPVNIGDKKPAGQDKRMLGEKPTTLMKVGVNNMQQVLALAGPESHGHGTGVLEGGEATLARMEREVQKAMQELIDARLVTVRHENLGLVVEINTDILFPSGAAAFTPKAAPVLDRLAKVLQPFPNAIRVEGHTDDRPIRTAAFPSNWELSAARAASVVHQFTRAGLDPLRLEIVGFGEYRPRKPNTTDEGRNANRRVAILILQAKPQEMQPNQPVPAGSPAVAQLVTAATATAQAVVPMANGDAGNAAAAGAAAVAVPPAPRPGTVLAEGQVQAAAAELKNR